MNFWATSVLALTTFCLFTFVDPVLGSDGNIEIIEKTLGNGSAPDGALTYPVAVLAGAGWEKDQIEGAVREAEAIYAQCGVVVTAGAIYWLRTPEDFLDLDEIEQAELLSKLPAERPLAVFADRTTDNDIAYSYLNSAPVASRGTVWITRRSSRSCTGPLLAHELGHILLDTASHSADRQNIMAYSCKHSNIARSEANTRLSEAQCQTLRKHP